ncbi:hypothetical protein RJ640_004456 [Escallonia rubra]|uniref:DUF7865 domain-containing protein n=1 Tax=Escallonia rubra TaxID=112253 RepID=A0AA88QSE1_9ASTE|nr:hypothetical protein RJ640_004456 [Escallonia rubra]
MEWTVGSEPLCRASMGCRYSGIIAELNRKPRPLYMESSGFFLICILHSVVALSCGTVMMFYSNEVFALSHGSETASKLLGSTPHDQLLIRTSDSFSGLLLFAIGFLLFMVAFVKDSHFQSFFAKGCVLLHVAMAIWRIYFERKLEDLSPDWLRLVVGDITLGLSWIPSTYCHVLKILSTYGYVFFR